MPTNYAVEADLDPMERMGRRLASFNPPPRKQPLSVTVCTWAVRVFAAVGVSGIVAVFLMMGRGG